MTPPPEVVHAGRGGHVRCRIGDGDVQLPIELVAGGAFTVWVRGAELVAPGRRPRRLRPPERAALIAELRRWLDASGRAAWTIEG